MLSVPAATTMSALPVIMVCAPIISDLIEEAQTLLMVVETVDSGRPAPMAHWRAGFWPRLLYQLAGASRVQLGSPYFAERTLPTKTSWTSSGFKPARSTAAEGLS
jgi:hypothetical protein